MASTLPRARSFPSDPELGLAPCACATVQVRRQPLVAPPRFPYGKAALYVIGSLLASFTIVTALCSRKQSQAQVVLAVRSAADRLATQDSTLAELTAGKPRKVLGEGAYIIEKRFPSPALPANFFWLNYLEVNHDLADEGVLSQSAAEEHYLKHGLQEGRKYRIDQVKREVDPWEITYEILPELLPEVPRIVKEEVPEPVKAMRSRPAAENKTLLLFAEDLPAAANVPTFATAASASKAKAQRAAKVAPVKQLPKGFDWRVYLELNPDLGKAGITTQEDVETHFLKKGGIEKRRFQPN